MNMYDPYNDASSTGFQRPPKDAVSVIAYIAALMLVEDDGELLRTEIAEMLSRPDTFFAPLDAHETCVRAPPFSVLCLVS